MYGRIERFEGTDANRLDASDDEQHRRAVLRERDTRAGGSRVVSANARSARHADDVVDEPPRRTPR